MTSDDNESDWQVALHPRAGRFAVKPMVAWCLFAALSSAPASARPVRPRFEPTDLELERPGLLELWH